MSDDLISRSALLKEINGDENKRADTLMREWYADMVRRQPTAYDVDKVVERMEMESQNIELIYQTDQGLDYEDAIGIDIINAKQIVKSGGIE